MTLKKNYQITSTRYSPEVLSEFRKIIEEKIKNTKSLLSELQSMMHKDKDHGISSTVKVFEDSSEIDSEEIFFSLIERQKSHLSKLEKAVERINNGTYGFCLKTGKLIEEDRLRLVPHTEYCLDAKLIET
jgi:DnaK suppressor protein